MAPMLHALAAKAGGRLVTAWIDIHAHPDAAVQFGVTRPPLFVLFADGTEQHRVGASPEQLAHLLDDTTAAAPAEHAAAVAELVPAQGPHEATLEAATERVPLPHTDRLAAVRAAALLEEQERVEDAWWIIK
jgi:thioredoxin-like negative regulator of GroEL